MSLLPDTSGISERLEGRFEALFRHTGRSSDHALFVPGRIEILGKHTDYAGGQSLTCASSHGIVALVYAHDAQSLIIEDVARGQRVEIPFAQPRPTASWTVYPVTVLRRVIRHFGTPPHGIRLVLASDLPSASGMSSSSALVVTVLLALLGEMEGPFPFHDRADLAGFAGAVESGADWKHLSGDDGVGTRGGSQDHTAILCSRPGQVSLFGYDPITCYERVDWPADAAFVIAGSGVKARKTGDALESYNRVSWRAAEVARLYAADVEEPYAHLGAMMAAPHFDRESLRWAIPDDNLWDRFQQFERECDHVLPEAVHALRHGDWAAFGRLTAESQQMAADWLENQVEETEALVEMAREAGARGASSFGAGFGGAVWAVVSADRVDDFTRTWQQTYHTRYPQHAAGSVFLLDRPGDPAWTSPGGLLGRMVEEG